jgi:hypothetical protein
MIALMVLLLRRFIPRQLETEAREHAQGADSGHQHHSAGGQISWAARLTDAAAWSDVAHNFRGDWQMVWKEVAAGFLIAGFVAELPGSVFSSLFLAGSPHALQIVWGAFIGPLIAVLSFVCSVGNVPLAAVLWSHGISFAGVIAFIFADLIVLPILAIYRKYYGAHDRAGVRGVGADPQRPAPNREPPLRFGDSRLQARAQRHRGAGLRCTLLANCAARRY